MTKQSKVLIFGTFDVLHPGHLSLINFAAKYGIITVALTPDVMCKKYKGTDVVHKFRERARRLQGLTYVKEVIAADSTPNSYKIIDKVKPDIIVLGHDQTTLKPNIIRRLDELHSAASIVEAPSYRAEIYKSSKFRNPLLQVAK